MRSTLKLFLVAALFAGCGQRQVPASETLDLATDLGVQKGSWIYYRDGQQIVQAGCPATGSRSRVTCNLAVRRLPVEAFVVEARDLPRLDADLAAARIRDIKVRFDHVELRVAELLDGTPDPTEAEALRAQIASENARVATLDTQLTGLDDQIQRIRERLAAGQGSPDLAIELIGLEADADATRGAREQRLAKLRELHARLIELKGDGRTDRDFRDLVLWRDALAAEWTAAQADHQKAIDERSHLTRALTYLFEDQIALPIEIDQRSVAFGELKPLVAELDGVFERAALAAGMGSREGWYAAPRRGLYLPDDVGDEPAQLQLEGWEHRQGFYNLFVQVSRFPNLKDGCLSGSGDIDPDLNTRSTSIEVVSCDGATGKPFGATKTCSWTNFYDNLATDRRYRIDLTLTFHGPSRISYEFVGQCFAPDADRWLLQRSERATVSFR